MILQLFTRFKTGLKGLVWLIDPDKWNREDIADQVGVANELGVDLIFVGGSLIFKPVDLLIDFVKEHTRIPVVLFPGSPLQISAKADATLFLSLISGRNPEYLIGNHVIAAPFLKESGLEVIPTGYVLIDGGFQTSVSYMSNTLPIPADKADIVLATALAGEMLGLKVIYLDAGSGARNPVSSRVISTVASQISLPLMVGGGIRTAHEARSAYQAGADILVVGNAAENSRKCIGEMIHERNLFNN